VLEEKYGERDVDYDSSSRSRPQYTRPEYDTDGGGDGGGRSRRRSSTASNESATDGATGGRYGAEPVPSSRGGLKNKTNVVRGLKA
jgi:hypothetical protein